MHTCDTIHRCHQVSPQINQPSQKKSKNQKSNAQPHQIYTFRALCSISNSNTRACAEAKRTDPPTTTFLRGKVRVGKKRRGSVQGLGFRVHALSAQEASDMNPKYEAARPGK